MMNRPAATEAPPSAAPASGDSRAQLGDIIHRLIDTASTLAANVEMMLAGAAGGCEPGLAADTRQSLSQLVSLARAAQRLKTSSRA